MTTARIAVLPEIRAPRERPFQIQTREIPPLVEGAVLVKNLMAGVCGTDVHILHGKVPVRLPAVLGHENAGRVEAIGGDAPIKDITGKTLQIGDTVTWLPKSCMRCYNCTILNDQSKCTNRVGYGGWVVPADQHPYFVGGFAEVSWVLPGSDFVLSRRVSLKAWCWAALRIMVHALDCLGGLGMAIRWWCRGRPRG